MRAPRNVSENGHRPIHFVESVIEDRFVVGIREVNYEIKNKIDRHSQYNS